MSPLKTSVLCVLLSVVSACGRQVVEFKNAEAADANINVASAPTVIFAIPANNATGVARDSTVTATFDEAMNAATITTSTFTLMQGATVVPGTVSLDAPTNTAIFVATASLGSNLVYTATVTTGAQDLGDIALAANYVWTFTTGSTVNAVPPTVIFTSPADLATNVSVTKRPTATFSKAMDPATLTGLTFTLEQGATPIVGSVTYNAATNTASFTPMMPLGLNLPYTATITTGAKDAGGLALAMNYSWTFMTGACSLAGIDLQSAGNFAVFAGQTVTSTVGTAVIGDLGVSPGTSVTGFPPGTITGMIHAGDTTAAAAGADLTLAYDDAAGRSLCAITVAGNIGGQTLTPGLYKSTSSLAISMGDLTLDAQGDVDAVFIFDMASTLTTTSGRQVFLTNGASAENIYWQVGTSATLGTTSAFAGTIMADQSITLDTGATLNGRALATNAAVNLDSNPITKP